MPTYCSSRSGLKQTLAHNRSGDRCLLSKGKLVPMPAAQSNLDSCRLDSPLRVCVHQSLLPCGRAGLRTGPRLLMKALGQTVVLHHPALFRHLVEIALAGMEEPVPALEREIVAQVRAEHRFYKGFSPPTRLTADDALRSHHTCMAQESLHLLRGSPLDLGACGD